MSTENTRKTAAAGNMTWGRRLAVLAAGLLVLLVSAVIAVVVIATQIGFYRQNMRVQDVEMLGLPPIDLPTFTPIAVEALAWVFTAMAVILVLCNRMAGRWTQSMWLFASIAAVVNGWHNMHQGDWLSGVVTGGLSVAGPYMVHMFVAFTRTMAHGKTIEQTLLDFGDRLASIRRSVAALAGHALDHAVHPVIAVRTIGIWRGHRGMSYDLAWLIASVNYRTRTKQRLIAAQSKITARGSADPARPDSATVHEPVEPVVLPFPFPDTEQTGDTVRDDIVHGAGIAVLDRAERESVTDVEELFARWEQQLADITVHDGDDQDGTTGRERDSRTTADRESRTAERASDRDSRRESHPVRRESRRESDRAHAPGKRTSGRARDRESRRARTDSGDRESAPETTGGMLKRDMVIRHYWDEHPGLTDFDGINFSAIGKELGVDRATVSRIYRECADGKHPRPTRTK